jgi:hypothetical protein
VIEGFNINKLEDELQNNLSKNGLTIEKFDEERVLF